MNDTDYVESTKDLRKLEKELTYMIDQMVAHTSSVITHPTLPEEYKEYFEMLQAALTGIGHIIDPLYGIEIPKISKDGLIEVLESIESDE